jgi:regulator of nonsense transcripts 1
VCPAAVPLQWQPIIEDRQFVRWLVKMPTDDERLRARRLSPQQVGWTYVC